MIKTVFIVGPTASGKTALSIEIAKKFGGEIVCADSMQIYKCIHIASAAPDEEEKSGIPHHLLEFLDLTESFSVADYVKLARKCIEEINSRGKLPVIVGGTGLYIDSLVNGVDFGEEQGDEKIREELTELAEKEGNEAVHKILAEVDPETAAKYHPNNLRRIIRAIEVYKTQGKTVSEKEKEEKISPYDVAYFCIDWDREVLYDRINRRVDIMVEDGLIEEVKSLLERDIDPSVTSMQSIGYKEFYGYLNGDSTLEEALDTIKQSSRRYAKRQLTWFRRNKDINWLKPETAFVDAMDVIKEKFKI